MPSRISLRRLAAGGIVAVVASCIVAAGQSIDPRVRYQHRGRHYEGVRAEPISGSVRLLSARVVDDAGHSDPAGRTASWEESATLRFYLPAPGSVNIVVRQVRPGSTYYVMDRVESTWTAGRENAYAWPTEPVLRKLADVTPSDLGAVVLFASSANPLDEKILPVTLLHATPSEKAYRFTLKTNGRARLEAVILDGGKTVGHRRPNWEDEDSPFVVAWSPPRSAREGWYRLLLRGQFEDGTKLDRVFEFYHRAAGVDTKERP